MTEPNAPDATPQFSWDRDTLDLPAVLVPNPPVNNAPPRPRHWLSTGQLTAVATPDGRMELRTADAPSRSLNLYGPHAWSAFYLTVTENSHAHNAQPLLLAPSQTQTIHDWTTSLGTFYTGFTGCLRACQLSFSLRIIAPWDTPFLIIQVALDNTATETADLTLCAASDFYPADWTDRQPPSPNVFCANGAALFTDALDEAGDYFMASSNDWEAGHVLNTLQLRRTLSIPAEEAFNETFLLGVSPQCSLEWLEQQKTQHTPETVEEDWKERFQKNALRAPELWMQQECTWDLARLYAHRTCTPDNRQAVVDQQNIRQCLTLTLPLTAVAPDMAFNHLVEATRRQLQNGRILPPENQIRNSDSFAPANDAADLEIWFLLGWTAYLQTIDTSDRMNEAFPFLDKDAKAPLAKHLFAAINWIMSYIGTGPHDLLHIGSRDSCSLLDRTGIRGNGESTLNTALLCVALRQLMDVFRKHAIQVDDVERLADWHRTLQDAVSNTFEQKWFTRAYTDNGQPIGNALSERLFADVQAWAVLARCGTAKERVTALESALERCTGSHPMHALSKPYPLPPPETVTSCRSIPGHAANGGHDPMVTACMIWALTAEGMNEPAMREWKRFTLQQQCEQDPTIMDTSAPPQIHRTAWQHFAMTRILQPKL